MKRTFYPICCIICCIIIIVIGYCCWYGPTTTVIVVRHAEKAATPPEDPPLTAAGQERAESLAHVLEKAGVDVIFATTFQRTQQTVAPTASNLGLTPIIIDATDQLVSTILSNHRGKQVLVAGHSPTVPDIIHKLGGPSGLMINDYDNLFVVHIKHYFCGYPSLTHLQYGEPAP